MFDIEFTYNKDSLSLSIKQYTIYLNQEIIDKYFKDMGHIEGSWKEYNLKINNKCIIYEKTADTHHHKKGALVIMLDSINILKEEIKKAHEKQFNVSLQEIIK